MHAGYPAEFFKRLKLPAEVVQACINACRSNDLCALACTSVTFYVKLPRLYKIPSVMHSQF